MRALVFCLMLLPGWGWADAYKCHTIGRVIYSQLPCGNDAELVHDNITITNPRDVGEPAAHGNPALIVSLNSRGTYTVSGRLNQVDASFEIDTGASVTTISQELADRAGLSSCEQRMVTDTANGTVGVCLLHVAEISFGRFHLREVPVQIVPRMASDALLGNSVLRGFRISQHDGVMTISD